MDAWIKYAKHLVQIISGIGRITAELAKVKEPEILMPEGEKPIAVIRKITPSTPQRIAIPAAQRPQREVSANGLSNPEQRILDAIAWMESIGVNEPEQTAVAFLADYTYGGGGFNNPKGSLRTKGLVEYRGDRITLTEAGRSLANVPDATLTTEELHKKRVPASSLKRLRLRRPR